MKRKLPLVVLEWHDAVTESGWISAEDYKPKTVKVISVGWLLSETDHHVSIIGSFNSEKDFSDITTVPKQWLIKCKILRGNKLDIGELL